MVVVELGGGGAEPVSVAEAKAWCRIERSDEDDLIAALVTAAREMVERETRAVLVKRGFRIALEAVPADRRVRLPRTPLGAVTMITAYGADGTSRNFMPAGATPDRASGEDVVVLADDVVAAAANGVEVEFIAGFDAGSVPEALKLAVKEIVAASYEMRGAVAADMQPGFIPKAVRDLLAPFRERRL
ncbi:head-tail connector protein [Aureimonas leprariae]|uniref:Phage gp6-like head-tail connector protein n=1 Tax=Plantimonas leprariae TaxID=2615207 RepID=A0A7V7PPL2_9HYPH|nr:head-tail connector protein [Aureimonas leprariae]KAB0679951.1 hypothetical protein F6X38_10275 [Aureimonas leprariae]